MPGGLMQLVGKGAQDVLVTGNPSFTHFRSMYKRHTEFAMEHFQLFFNYSKLALPAQGNITLQTKVDRNAQLLHDCYLSVTIPDIYSPVVPNGVNQAIGYEFQWIKNLGYNMINYIAVTINGSEIVRHTGEWMKLYAALKFDKAKKDMVNQMVGNTPDFYDPANAYDRINQYPHAISTATSLAAPSIPGRVLSIPLHFWFCELIGNALPLIAMQHSEVAFIVELKNMYQLFTVRDVTNAVPTRITLNSTTSMARFLSPPTYAVTPQPSNTQLLFWNLNPFIEANYIFVSDAEMAYIATTDHSFLIHEVNLVETDNQYSVGDDIDLGMHNLCTRVVWVAQRSDRYALNDWDNYTNWTDPQKPPFLSTGSFPWYTSGNQQAAGITSREIMITSNIVLDGKDRFTEKQYQFFDEIQHYRHHTGTTSIELPGVYAYSFALEHNTGQPSGAINGSQFNKTLLRNVYVQPPLGTSQTQTTLCILKSTANDPNPTYIDNPADYKPNEVVTIIRKSPGSIYQYTFTINAYVESYNFLRVIGGVANVVFSS
jgi:hypothetical protein